MSKYNFGKIYKLVSPNTNKIYIGSTCKKYLCQRMADHNTRFKKWNLNNDNENYYSSFEIMKCGQVQIILLESVNCNSKDELLKKEREHIDKNIDNIINKNLPTRTNKQYYRDNIVSIKEKKNKIINCECGKNYTQTNKAKHLKSHNL
jgi:hypothetical protein